MVRSSEEAGAFWDVPFAVSADTMRSAVLNLTGQAATVGFTTQREGSYLASAWTVTFPQGSYNAVPPLFLEHASDESTPSGVKLAAEVRPASPLMTGSVKISYGSECDSVALAVTASADEVKAALTTLPGMAAPTRVER